ncbi:hypothetical protein D3C85_1280990 [compost metagenome]
MAQIALTQGQAQRRRVNAQVGHIDQAELTIFKHQNVTQVQRAEINTLFMQLSHELAKSLHQRLAHRGCGYALQDLAQGIAGQRRVVHGAAAV